MERTRTKPAFDRAPRGGDARGATAAPRRCKLSPADAAPTKSQRRREDILRKATELGIRILDEEEFLKMTGSRS